MRGTLPEVVDRVGAANVAAIGITNQRETVVRVGPRDRQAVRPRDRLAGPPHRGPLRRELADDGHLALVRERTGLVLDPYFSGTKIEWLLDATAASPVERRPRARHRSTRGSSGTSPAARCTSPTSNASRTMLFDIRSLRVGRRAVRLLGVPRRAARGRPVERAVRRHVATRCGVPAGIPISGIAGDQQAALFGQACFAAGHGEEHVRHRQLRPAERRPDVPAAVGRAC